MLFWEPMIDSNGYQQNQPLARGDGTGKLREQFCLGYFDHKKKLIPLIEESLSKEAMLHNEDISCSKGCAACCSGFIAASLQECEAIAYWLCRRQDMLSLFLKNYPSWRERIGSLESAFQTIIRGFEEDRPAAAELTSAMDRYRRERVPCPFLYENACSIYEVRPWACAGVVSVSPREWCDVTHPNYGKLKTYRFDTYSMFEKPFYVNLAKSIYVGCLPETVYGLLR